VPQAATCDNKAKTGR